MHLEQVALRRKRLTSLAALDQGVGLEIGPLDSPIALKEECGVKYVDVVGTSRLREQFRDDPNVSLDAVVDVDFTLLDANGNIRSLAEVASPYGPFDWVVASHVIEHVPDLIGWLADIAEVLTDEGRLLLVVPDKRYTFDTRRPLTTVGQILEAHTRGDKTPSERAVFDHFRSIVTVPVADLWAGQPGSLYPRLYSFEDAANVRRNALETGNYIDSHVWLFTPSVLVEQIVELGRLGESEFLIEDIVPTALNELEFYVSLRRIPRGLERAQAESVRARGLQSLVEDAPFSAASEWRDAPDAGPSHGYSTLGPAPAVGLEPTVLSERELKLIEAKRNVMRLVHRLIR